MLLSLIIRDFIIVDQLELDFSAGFTVLSGETGAGKSILIDALSLTLGGRTDLSMIREGSQKADICATYRAPNTILSWLEEQGFTLDDGLLLIRRVIEIEGRSKAYINGVPATLAQLREAGEFLINIHGQHAHQTLLKTDTQRQLLDDHANLTELVQEISHHFNEWQQFEKQITQIKKNAATSERERERLQWQVEELEQLAPQPNEWEEIQNEHTRLANAATLLEGVQNTIQVLSENDGAAVLEQLSGQISRLSHLTQYDKRLETILETLEPAQIQIQEAISSLNHYLDRAELDPQRFQEVAFRMEAFHNNARKLQVKPQELVTTLENLRSELTCLQTTSDISELELQAELARKSYQKSAKSLSQKRTEAAQRLSESVTQAMQTLSMAGGQFVIALNPQEPTRFGVEQVEFLVAGHTGVTPQPLNKVASGGELARISLALAVITNAVTPIPTLIFDEVDSGIGGAVAEVVGRLLRQLGQQRQVLCVTHLPQVAAQGEHHLVVNKITTPTGHTLSQITILDAQTRISEIARMLGGLEITDTTRKHAREMLSL